MNYRKLLSYLTVLLFLGLASLPAWGMLFPALTRDAGENRALAHWPRPFTPQGAEDWFDDHFALRGPMTALYNRVNARTGLTEVNGVATGRDGWLYYMYDGSREDIRREIHYSAEELERICSAQQQTKDDLAAMGIDYYLVICPDKHTVYPEFLPESLSGYTGPSRLDGMLEAMAENTDVKVIDTRQTVIDEKQNHRVFFKTDTHWNGYGAFAAYEQIIGRIGEDHPAVRRIAREDCDVLIDENWREGDMAGFIGQADTLADTDVTFQVKDSSLIRLKTPYAETSDDPDRPILCMENPAHPELPTAVVFRDSFCKKLYPMLADSFSKVTFVWSTSVMYSIVENEQPDLVIMEYVERYSGFAANGMDAPEAKLADYESGNLPLPEHKGLIRSNVDGMDTSREICTLAGWAFDPDGDCLKGDKHIALVCGEDVIWCETASVLRPDVTAAYADSLGGKNVDYAGFSASFRKSDLHPGKWQVIVVIDDGAGSAAYTELNKRVRID